MRSSGMQRCHRRRRNHRQRCRQRRSTLIAMTLIGARYRGNTPSFILLTRVALLTASRIATATKLTARLAPSFTVRYSVIMSYRASTPVTWRCTSAVSLVYYSQMFNKSIHLQMCLFQPPDSYTRRTSISSFRRNNELPPVVSHFCTVSK